MRPADNPFRTERIDRLPYRLTGATLDDLAGRFAALGGRAAIVGEHGAGKSRLLATLADHLETRGRPSLRIRCGRDPLPSAEQLAGRLLVADELDRLGRLRRRLLLARAVRAGGVLAAVHRVPRDLPLYDRSAARCPEAAIVHLFGEPAVIPRAPASASSSPPPRRTA